MDLLSLQTIGTTEKTDNNNFDWLFNKKTLDNKFDEAIKGMSQANDKLWK